MRRMRMMRFAVVAGAVVAVGAVVAQAAVWLAPAW